MEFLRSTPSSSLLFILFLCIISYCHAIRSCVDPHAHPLNSLSLISSFSVRRLDRPLQCECDEGFRKHSSMQLCVPHRCEKSCGQTFCASDELNPFDPELTCHCPPGFTPLNRASGMVCTPLLQIQQLGGQDLQHAPENPLLARQLGCDHLYQLHPLPKTSDYQLIHHEHRCACFSGYKLAVDNRTCEPEHELICDPGCNDRQLCILDVNTQKPVCQCRLGFKGKDCEISYCDLPQQTNITAALLDHVRTSIASVCHTQSCYQRPENQGRADCFCPYGRYTLDERGGCRLKRVCEQDSSEWNECTGQGAFCVPMESERGYECRCPLLRSHQTSDNNTCRERPVDPQTELRYRLTQVDQYGCLPGLVDRRKYSDNLGQELLCEPAVVSFTIPLRLLVDAWRPSNFELLYEDLVEGVKRYRCFNWHAVDPEECVQFKRELMQRNFRLAQHEDLWYRKILDVLRRGFRQALVGACPAEHVHLQNLNLDSSDPLQLHRTWAHLELLVSCAEPVEEEHVRSVLRSRLQPNVVEGLLYLQETAYIDAESL